MGTAQFDVSIDALKGLHTLLYKLVWCIFYNLYCKNRASNSTDEVSAQTICFRLRLNGSYRKFQVLSSLVVYSRPRQLLQLIGCHTQLVIAVQVVIVHVLFGYSSSRLFVATVLSA